MEWDTLFFSFRGRINRAKYWLATLVYFVIGLVLLGLKYGLGPSLGYSALSSIVNIVVFVSGLAVAVKRLHDRDKSAWWLLLFYALPSLIVVTLVIMIFSGQQLTMAFALWFIAPFAIWIWVIVELGILSGTPGPNAYGLDPLGRE